MTLFFLLKKIKNCAKESGLFILHSIFSIILAFFLVFFFGIIGVAGVNVVLFGCFLVVGGIFYLLVKKLRKKNYNKAKLIFSTVLYFLITQTILVLFSPMLSLVPREALLRVGIIEKIPQDVCDIERKLKVAGDFFRGAIKVDKIEVFYGGPVNTSNFLFNFIEEKTGKPMMRIGGSVWDKTSIFIAKTPLCPSDELFIHEVTHIWQVEQGKFFGFSGPFDFISLFIGYIKDPDSLYDYGGYEGLKEARAEGKKFVDFNIEQQANIMADYFLISKYKEYYEYYSKESISLYEYFVFQVIER